MCVLQHIYLTPVLSPAAAAAAVQSQRMLKVGLNFKCSSCWRIIPSKLLFLSLIPYVLLLLLQLCWAVSLAVVQQLLGDRMFLEYTLYSVVSHPLLLLLLLIAGNPLVNLL